MFLIFPTPLGVVKGVVRPPGGSENYPPKHLSKKTFVRRPGGSEKLPTKTPLEKAIRTTVGGFYTPGRARVLHMYYKKGKKERISRSFSLVRLFLFLFLRFKMKT